MQKLYQGPGRHICGRIVEGGGWLKSPLQYLNVGACGVGETHLCWKTVEILQEMLEGPTAYWYLLLARE